MLGAFTGRGSISEQEITELTSRKWTVVSVAYRFVPAALFEDIVEDMEDAYAWIRKDLSKIQPINPDLISIFGASAGGGLALIAGYRVTPRPKSLIIFYPYCSNYNDPGMNDPTTSPSEQLLNMISEVNQPISGYDGWGSGDPRFELWNQMSLEKKGGWIMVSRDPKESAESIRKKLKAFSAVDNVGRDFPPTYLTHGLNDDTVLFSQSINMAEKLEENNIEFVLDLVWGEKHMYDLWNPTERNWRNHVLPAFNFAAKFMK